METSRLFLGLLFLALSLAAYGDATDAMVFCCQKHQVSAPLVAGKVNVVHYYKPACNCCQETATRLTRHAQDNSALFHYVGMPCDAEGLPRFEVYDQQGTCIHTGESARLWLEVVARETPKDDAESPNL